MVKKEKSYKLEIARYQHEDSEDIIVFAAYLFCELDMVEFF